MVLRKDAEIKSLEDQIDMMQGYVDSVKEIEAKEKQQAFEKLRLDEKIGQIMKAEVEVRLLRESLT